MADTPWLGGVVTTINMNKCALVVKHRNMPSLGPDKNSITVENKRSLGEELAQALSVTEERLSCGDRKAVVSDEDDLAAKSWSVRKNRIKLAASKFMVGEDESIAV